MKVVELRVESRIAYAYAFHPPIGIGYVLRTRATSCRQCSPPPPSAPAAARRTVHARGRPPMLMLLSLLLVGGLVEERGGGSGRGVKA